VTPTAGSGAWPWPALSSTLAAELVAPHLPTGLREPLEAEGEGDFCLAYASGAWIVRVAKHAEAAQALRRESCVLERIAAALPLPVPRPELSDPGECPPFTVHRRVEGGVLTRAAWEGLPSAPRWTLERLDRGTPADVAHGLGEITRELG
jgi:aminoglycoside phosphotransferase (APT) family kinase protein